MSDAGLRHVLNLLYDGESGLSQQLLDIAARHVEEHEIVHVATDLAGWSLQNAEAVRAVAAGQRVTLETRSDGGIRLAGNEVVARGRHVLTLLLLQDLHDLYLAASSNSLGWEMLGQLGQATKNSACREASASCHPRTLRQVRWANTMIKTLSPQALTSLPA